MSLSLWISWLLAAADVLGLRAAAHNIGRVLPISLVLFLLIYLLERATGSVTSAYRSRSFLHDVLYWMYYNSGLQRLIVTATFFHVAGPYLDFLKLGLIERWPVPVRYVVLFLATDFLAYWMHRLRHTAGFLWAFHAVHHSQEQLTPVTIARAHPVDEFMVGLAYVPLMVLGAAPEYWLPLAVTMRFFELILHSNLSWSFGPLYPVFSSPLFHSVHHSTDPRHYNRNFGVTLSLWDFLFGTAVVASERPSSYGLPDLKLPSLLEQLLVPFRLALRPSPPAPDVTSQVR